LASSNRHHSVPIVIVLRRGLSRAKATPATLTGRGARVGEALQYWSEFRRIVSTCCRPDTSTCDQSHAQKNCLVHLAMTIGAMPWCRDGSARVIFVTADCDLLASAAASHSKNVPACCDPQHASPQRCLVAHSYWPCWQNGRLFSQPGGR
jgi:hypothetical protein